MSPRTDLDLAHVRSLDHDTSMRIAAREQDLLAEVLRDLDEEEWKRSTDCDLWSVRDIVSHLIGWGECLTSMREASHQVGASFRRRGEFQNLVDAQNQVQVDDRNGLTTDELIESYVTTSERFLRLRRRAGLVGKAIPFYHPMVGGRASLGFVADAIFTRDTFMHRIDITQATGHRFEVGLLQELLILDIARDWATRTEVPVSLHLSGPGGGDFSYGEPRVTLRSSAIDFCRFMARRVPDDEMDISGPPDDVARCLRVRAPF